MSVQSLEALKAAIEKERRNMWTMLRDLSRATPEDLRSSGYGSYSNAEAMKLCFDRACARIEQMLRKFEKENPE